MYNKKSRIIIIGAGPAGLTAATELQRYGFHDITVLEQDALVGGISRTVNHNNNRIDIGGHRFFSKSNWVMDWWLKFMPLDKESSPDVSQAILKYQGQSRSVPSDDVDNGSQKGDFLLRNRLSRIFFNKTFFNYPLALNYKTVKSLGFATSIKFGISYFIRKLLPKRPEESLEDFFINRFGDQLYYRFFKDYTEKVWGVPCSQISAEWGAQRIKSLSIVSALLHTIKKKLRFKAKVEQTSLIESFLYPKYGPGQLWERVSEVFEQGGGKIVFNSRVNKLSYHKGKIGSVTYTNDVGQYINLSCDVVLSTMPVRDLVLCGPDNFSQLAQKIALGLEYRDFITVGVLLLKEDFTEDLKDNWIYIQEPGFVVGRIQIFNNWSPYMVHSDDHIWIGLEYFCNENDGLWKMEDRALYELATNEIKSLGLVTSDTSPVDHVVIKVPKAYPGYFGAAYQQFEKLREELDAVDNLFLIGRNGMHRYNNQDHSMLTAAEAAKQISSGNVNKDVIWGINVDDDYHEQK